MGKQDIVFAGGAEEVHWTLTVLFDAMGALSPRYNDTPEKASRPYDANRDGFVISGGGGILVLEELEHAKARGAQDLCRTGRLRRHLGRRDMVQPSGEGAVRCMRMALADVKRPIDYINTHGTSTPVGDPRSWRPSARCSATSVPPISSTKSLTGHALGAAGVNEAIYALLMMQHGFICASANIEQLDPAAEGLDIVRERLDGAGSTPSCPTASASAAPTPRSYSSASPLST